MVLALATDDRGLMIFPGSAEAIAYCERVDVEAGAWSFFAEDGSPLKPNLEGRPPLYALTPDPNSSAHLATLLDNVSYVEGCGITSVAQLEDILKRTSRDGLR